MYLACSDSTGLPKVRDAAVTAARGSTEQVVRTLGQALMYASICAWNSPVKKEAAYNPSGADLTNSIPSEVSHIRTLILDALSSG